MFAPALYLPIYLFTVYLLAIVKMIPPENILVRESRSSGLTKTWIVGILFIIFFGFRPTEYEPNLYMADTIGYAGYYDIIKDGLNVLYTDLLNDDNTFNFNSEFLFCGIRNIMAYLDFPVSFWFVIVASILIIPKILTVKLLFPGREYLAFLFLITALGFYSGGTNGIRNANGSSIFLLGLVFLCCGHPRKLLGMILCISSYFFHHSEVILIVSLLLSLFVVKKTNLAIIIWLVAIICALAAGNALASTIGPLFEDDRVNSYILNNSSDVKPRFRWDFLCYSAAPILMGWYTTVKLGIKDKAYQIILNTYIIANAIWVIFIYASFTNRFAALSWSLYPIVLCYPLLRHNVFGAGTASKTALILCFQLLFITII